MNLPFNLFVLLSFSDLCVGVVEGSEGEGKGLDDLLISGVDLASELAVVFVVAGDIIEVGDRHLLVVALRSLLQ